MVRGLRALKTVFFPAKNEEKLDKLALACFTDIKGACRREMSDVSCEVWSAVCSPGAVMQRATRRYSTHSRRVCQFLNVIRTHRWFADEDMIFTHIRLKTAFSFFTRIERIMW